MTDWSKHVHLFAKKHNMSYKKANVSKKCKETYKKRKNKMSPWGRKNRKRLNVPPGDESENENEIETENENENYNISERERQNLLTEGEMELSEGEEGEIIYVSNFWEQEPGCSGGDGKSYVYFTTIGNQPPEETRHYQEEDMEELRPGQYLLISIEQNVEVSCCSGYTRSSIEILEAEPDTDNTVLYPDYGWDGSKMEYIVFTYEEALEEVNNGRSQNW